MKLDNEILFIIHAAIHLNCSKFCELFQTPSVAFLSTLFPLMVCGNVVVLTLILKKRGRKTRMDLLFANTACAGKHIVQFTILYRSP